MKKPFSPLPSDFQNKMEKGKQEWLKRFPEPTKEQLEEMKRAQQEGMDETFERNPNHV